MATRRGRNIRAVGGKTVHNGDPKVPCGFRDKIAPDKIEYTDEPVNCKIETGFDRTGGTHVSRPIQSDAPTSTAHETTTEQPVETTETTLAAVPLNEDQDQDESRALALVRVSPVMGIGQAISDLGRVVTSLENTTPAVFGKAIEEIGFGLVRLGVRTQDIV